MKMPLFGRAKRARLAAELAAQQAAAMEAQQATAREAEAQTAARQAADAAAIEREAAIQAAILHGFSAAGLHILHANVDSFDLLATGKWHEVAYYAGQQLGIEIRTVGDLKALLRRAR